MLDETSKRRVIDTLGLGSLFWLIGYALGMIFFTLVDVRSIGLYVLLFMLPLTVYIAIRRFEGSEEKIPYFVFVGIVWLTIAVTLDYLLLVRAFDVKDYYDLDVLVYYALMLVIPIVVGLKSRK